MLNKESFKNLYYDNVTSDFYIVRIKNNYFITTNKLATSSLSKILKIDNIDDYDFNLTWVHNEYIITHKDNPLISEDTLAECRDIQNELYKYLNKREPSDLNIYVLYKNPIDFILGAIAEDYIKINPDIEDDDKKILDDYLRELLDRDDLPRTRLRTDFFDKGESLQLEYKIIKQNINRYFSTTYGEFNQENWLGFPHTRHYNPTYFKTIYTIKNRWSKKVKAIDIGKEDLSEYGITIIENSNSSYFKILFNKIFTECLNEQDLVTKYKFLDLISKDIDYYNLLKNE